MVASNYHEGLSELRISIVHRALAWDTGDQAWKRNLEVQCPHTAVADSTKNGNCIMIVPYPNLIVAHFFWFANCLALCIQNDGILMLNLA